MYSTASNVRTLDSKTSWPQFIDRHWERTHAHVPQVEQCMAVPSIKPDELFAAVVACAEQYALGKGQIIRLYLDNIEINVLRDGKQHLLPQSHDSSFEGYHQRIVDQTGSQDYSLIVTDWHQFDRSIWNRIVRTVAEISDVVGISASRIDTQLFLGTYKRTPFGVHVDDTSTFHFPIIGNKTMRFWSNEFASKTPKLHHAKQYQAFEHASTQVTAVPGDMIYWPSDYWHVGEGDGDLSVTWRFAYWKADGFRQFAARRVADQLSARSAAANTAFSAPTNGGQVDAFEVADVVADMTELVQSAEYQNELMRVMLEQISAFGFLRLPAVLGKKEITDQPFCLKKPFKFFTSALSRQRACVSIAGFSIELRESPALHKLVDLLNSGNVFSRSELVSRGYSLTSVEALLELGFASGGLSQ